MEKTKKAPRALRPFLGGRDYDLSAKRVMESDYLMVKALEKTRRQVAKALHGTPQQAEVLALLDELHRVQCQEAGVAWAAPGTEG